MLQQETRTRRTIAKCAALCAACVPNLPGSPLVARTVAAVTDVTSEVGMGIAICYQAWQCLLAWVCDAVSRSVAVNDPCPQVSHLLLSSRVRCPAFTFLTWQKDRFVT